MKIRIGLVTGLLALVVLIFSTSVFASGDENHGSKGKGAIKIGTTAAGKANQKRGGQ